MKTILVILKTVQVIVFLIGALFFIGGVYEGSALAIVGIFIMLIASKLSYKKESEEFKNKVLDDTSFLNFINQKRGYRWSNVKDIEKFSKGRDIYIDNFAFFNETKKAICEQAKISLDEYETSKKKYIKNCKKLNDITLNLKALDFTQTILALGKMGSGKTEFFNSLLSQNKSFNFFNREIIHDVKGDFTQKFYNPDTDYIFNPYDVRGFYWSIWEDMKVNETLVISFVKNLIESGLKEKDFFSSSATNKLTDYFLETHFEAENLSDVEKWDIFSKKIEAYQDSIGDDKTKSSIFATMELALEHFRFFAFLSSQPNINTFTINSFLKTKGRLILLNNASYSKTLNPLFTGFLAMLFEMMLSFDDTKEDLSLILLDEFISLKFDEETRTKLMTQIRSKGGCLVIGVQYLDMAQKAQKQLLDSSKFMMLVFQLSDLETIEHICKAFHKVEFMEYTKSRSSSGGHNGNTTSSSSEQIREVDFLTPQLLQSMPSYHHISFIPDKEIIYLGYTKLVELKTVNSNFEKRNISEFYKNKVLKAHISPTSNENEKEDKDIGFDSDGSKYSISATQNALFKYSLEDKKKIWAELSEFETEEDYKNIVKKYDIENISFDKFFDGVISDS